jgi:pyrroloquinoline-quinone synthase
MVVHPEVGPAADFVGRLRTEIAAHPKLRTRHPFVHAVNEGRASLEHIQEWARQDYQFRRAVPRLAMLRYLACTDPEIAERLYEVVEEETQGLTTGSAGHVDMFREFAAALGLTADELDSAPLRPATAAHLYWVELIVHTQPWFIVMAAQMAAEGTAPAAMAALARGFTAHYGLSPEAVRFFTVHVDADEDHGSIAELIAERYLTSPELQAQARATALRRLELQYDVWTIDHPPLG